MSLLPAELRAQLPQLYAQESEQDPMVYARLFAPGTNWTWYVTEGADVEGDFRCFGYVIGLEREWGYFSLSEVESVRVPPYGLAIERDLYFAPARWSEVQKREGMNDPLEPEEGCGCNAG